MTVGVIAVAAYLFCMGVFGIAVVLLIKSGQAPKWLVDEDPHDKYDEPK